MADLEVDVVEILEQGSVSFVALVGPAGQAGAAVPARVDALYVVLAPDGRAPLRRLAVRRRRLPDPARGQRFLAHVDRIAAGAGHLTDDVRRRDGPSPRVLAVGRYALARHGDHVHLAYALARACRRGALAAAAGVAHGGSFVLSVFRRSLPPTRRPGPAHAPLAPATPERLDVLGADVAIVAGGRPRDGRLGLATGGPGDRVGDALVGALLRRGPRPRVASFAKAAESRRAGLRRPGGVAQSVK